MKKILIILFIALILFIILIYSSLWSGTSKSEDSKAVNLENIESIKRNKQDSVLISATTLYDSNALKDVMQGEQYREAWAMPIKVPIVYLDTLRGGLRVLKKGGGKQTQSLKLEGSNGILYTIRSINKDPDALIPEFAKELGLENIVIDGVSAQHPYAATVVANLAASCGILQTFPKIIFVPKQPELKEFNEEFGNRLYLFEYETESKLNWTDLKDVTEIIDTKELQELKMKYGINVHINENALVRARLFDFIIGDWDRHAKQWGWVIQKTDDKYVAYPLPCDRDNAFFNLGGVIPNMISNENVLPEVRPFTTEIDYLPGLVQRFDVYFLHKTPKHVFIEQAEVLRDLLTDENIDKALHEWPKEFYDLDAASIELKIKSRREHIVEYAKEFYKVLQKKDLLTLPLKGSEETILDNHLIECFECN